ncbi:MAG: ribonuclease [Caulobacteraceae bacterium]|nr:ribonuclease [Caulobacteraceae bacterium]
MAAKGKIRAKTPVAGKPQAPPVPGLSKPTTGPPEDFEKAEPGRGRIAASPRRIPWTGWGDILWRTWREVEADRLNAVAAGVTFYALLAIFPAVGVFVSIYGLVADVARVSDQLGDLAAFVPREALGLVGDQMVRLASQRDSSLSLAFAVSLLVSLWSANAGMSALFDGLNVAYDEEERRNFALRRAVTLGFTFAAILFAVAVAGVLVAVPLVLERIDADVLLPLVIPLRWVFLLGLTAGSFAVIYRYGPSRERARWRWVTVGGVAAAALWVGGSLGFSWYLNNVAHFDRTYGPLAAVVGFMMWLWFSAMVVLLGAELNAEIEHQTALDSTTGEPQPMGERGAAMADTVGRRFAGLRAGIAWFHDTLGAQVGRFRKPRRS